MENKIIILHWNDIILGGLSSVEEKYVYTKKKENYEAALEDGCPIPIMDTAEGLIKNIPPIFTEFEIDDSREDLKEKLNIESGDSRFDILYKRAVNYKLFEKKGFWISNG